MAVSVAILAQAILAQVATRCKTRTLQDRLPRYRGGSDADAEWLPCYNRGHVAQTSMCASWRQLVALLCLVMVRAFPAKECFKQWNDAWLCLRNAYKYAAALLVVAGH